MIILYVKCTCIYVVARSRVYVRSLVSMDSQVSVQQHVLGMRRYYILMHVQCRRTVFIGMASQPGQLQHPPQQPLDVVKPWRMFMLESE